MEYFQDVPKIRNNQMFESEFLEIPGAESGHLPLISLMLSGDENLVKPDLVVDQIPESRHWAGVFR